MEEYRRRCEEQIQELFRLAAEAEACGQLLRQEAERLQRLLADDSLDAEALREMAVARESLRISPERFSRPLEGLM